VHAFPRARRAAIDLAARERLFLRIPGEPQLGLPVLPDMVEEITTIQELAKPFRVAFGGTGALCADAFRGLANRVTAGPRLTCLRAALEHLPETGLVELMVHPAKGDRGELDALVDPSWPDWLAERGIALVSFREELLRGPQEPQWYRRPTTTG
jgi:hypothetical protein